MNKKEMSYYNLGRTLKLAGIILFVLWIMIIVLLNIFGVFVDPRLHTIAVLLSVLIIAIGFLIDMKW